VKDGKTLENDFAKGFNPHNPCVTADCMVTKATWPSKIDVKKRVGSMMVWLEDKFDADHLLRTSTGLFVCDQRILLTFYRQGQQRSMLARQHVRAQAGVVHQPDHVCAICSEGHRWGGCMNKDSPKCPACRDAYAVSVRTCKLHPQRYRHVGQQRASAQQGYCSATFDVDMDGITQTSWTSASTASGRACIVGTTNTSGTTPCYGNPRCSIWTSASEGRFFVDLAVVISVTSDRDHSRNPVSCCPKTDYRSASLQGPAIL
jgi:hypothetical protein